VRDQDQGEELSVKTLSLVHVTDDARWNRQAELLVIVMSKLLKRPSAMHQLIHY